VATPSVTCRNCGEIAGPRFCGTCGQAIDDRRSPLLGVIAELLEEALSLDSRSVRTLRALVHPGRLTELYLSGKRAPFLAPLRLYLLASVVLFSSAFALEPFDANTVNFYLGGELLTESPAVKGRPNLTFFNSGGFTDRWLLTIYADNFARLKAKGAQAAIDVLFRGLRSVLPIALIAFLPLLALAFKLLYVRRHVLYVDHLIFAAHFQSALFFMFAVAWLCARALQFPTVGTLLLQLVVFLLMVTLYLGKALRRLHVESRMMTVGKTFVLMFAYLFTLQWVMAPAMIIVIWQI
jgi:hypothetical protein